MMLRIFMGCLTAVLLQNSVPNADAQISATFSMQNGVVTGGRVNVGGVVSADRRSVMLGINASTSQLIDVYRFNLLNGATSGGGAGGGGGGNLMGSNQRRRAQQASSPTSQQFVEAAGRFDQDANAQLNRQELTLVARAVLTELHQAQHLPAAWRFSHPNQKLPAAPPSEKQLVESFVSRCLTFDKNKDEALNADETKRMAAVLLRALLTGA